MMFFKSSHFGVSAAVSLSLVSIAALNAAPAAAQSTYSPRPPYGTAPPASAANLTVGPGNGNGNGSVGNGPVVSQQSAPAQQSQQNASGGLGGLGSTSRPAPASPMPMPLPFDKVGSAIDQSAPLTPAEIRKFMQQIEERRETGNENFTGRPAARPVTSQEQVDLSPGSVPPVVRVAMGQGTILSFADAAGRPWPIADDRNFNTRAYEVKLVAPHLYSISLNKREAANMTVVLKGLARPIIITVLPATDETDYLKEYTIPKFLDDTPPATVTASSREGALSFNSPELLNYLYRTPPKGVKQLTVAGLPDVMAWQLSPTKMIVRTAGQVVIPAFSRRHGSTDGVTVFEVPLSPVVSISQGGALHRVSIGDYIIDTSSAASVSANNKK